MGGEWTSLSPGAGVYTVANDPDPDPERKAHEANEETISAKDAAGRSVGFEGVDKIKVRGKKVETPAVQKATDEAEKKQKKQTEDEEPWEEEWHPWRRRMRIRMMRRRNSMRRMTLSDGGGMRRRRLLSAVKGGGGGGGGGGSRMKLGALALLLRLDKPGRLWVHSQHPTVREPYT